MGLFLDCPIGSQSIAALSGGPLSGGMYTIEVRNKYTQINRKHSHSVCTHTYTEDCATVHVRGHRGLIRCQIVVFISSGGAPSGPPVPSEVTSMTGDGAIKSRHNFISLQTNSHTLEGPDGSWITVPEQGSLSYKSMLLGRAQSSMKASKQQTG